MSDTYCNEPYRVVHFDYEGNLGPCCTYRGERSGITNIEEYWNSEWLKNLKQELGSGKKYPGCFTCWRKEERGESSQRTEKLAKHGVVTDAEIREVWLSFGNICNKSCNICRPKRSSIIEKQYREAGPSWYKNWKGLSTKWLEKLPEYYDSIGRADVLNINGGEPFIVKQCNDLLQYMTENGYTDKNIKANTNGSITPAQCEVLNRFSKVSLHLSIDGILGLYSVVRPPHDWEWWTAQHDLIRKQKYFITYACVAHVLNIHQLPLILDYFHKQWEAYPDHTSIYFSAVNSQPNMSSHIAPPAVLNQSADLLEQRIPDLPPSWQDNIANLVKHLRYSVDNRNFKHELAFREFIKTFGPIKDIDYQSQIPWSL